MDECACVGSNSIQLCLVRVILCGVPDCPEWTDIKRRVVRRRKKFLIIDYALLTSWIAYKDFSFKRVFVHTRARARAKKTRFFFLRFVLLHTRPYINIFFLINIFICAILTYCTIIKRKTIFLNDSFAIYNSVCWIYGKSSRVPSPRGYVYRDFLISHILYYYYTSLYK